MKRASYRDAIEWIALNDSVGDDGSNDPVIVSSLVSSILVADLFDVPSIKVGEDVVKKRIAFGLVKTDEAIYVTSYCNKAHRMRDGKPIEHECHVLPPRALYAERDGDTETATFFIEGAKPLMLMIKGVKG